MWNKFFKARSNSTPVTVSDILKSCPSTEVGHYVLKDQNQRIVYDGPTPVPVPLIYEDWEEIVARRFSPDGFMEHQEKLLEDLPPARPYNSATPINEGMQQAVRENRDQAVQLAIEALDQVGPGNAWSILAATGRLADQTLLPSIKRIALESPSATDRAFALKQLAYYSDPSINQVLISALFDDAQSIRILVMELLASRGDHLGDPGIVLSDGLINPFRAYFIEQALCRFFGKSMPDPWSFFSMPIEARFQKLQERTPALCHRYMQAAEQLKNRPIAALLLFCLGSDSQSRSALDTLVTTLSEQGRRPDTFHGPDFFLRCCIIPSFQQLSKDRSAWLEKTFIKHVSEYRNEYDMLLLTLSFGLSHASERGIAALTKVRELVTDNYDLYMSAAEMLGRLGSVEAFPSFIHILELRREPFCTVAALSMSNLTGVVTPGCKPPDMPQPGRLNLDQIFQFWNGWFNANKDRLRYDPAKKGFLVL